MLQMLAALDWRIAGLLAAALTVVFPFERFAPGYGGWRDDGESDDPRS
jgi:hypothetical protein